MSGAKLCCLCCLAHPLWLPAPEEAPAHLCDLPLQLLARVFDLPCPLPPVKLLAQGAVALMSPYHWKQPDGEESFGSGLDGLQLQHRELEAEIGTVHYPPPQHSE